MNKVLEVLTNYMKVASTAINAGKDAAPYALDIYEILVKGKTVTQDDLDRLAAKSDAISDEIQKPLAPEE